MAAGEYPVGLDEDMGPERTGSGPLSTAGVSEKTVSVATAASCLLGMLSAGFLDFKCFFIGKVLGKETLQWVDCSMVF